MSFASTALEQMNDEERFAFSSVCELVQLSVQYASWPLRTPAMIGAWLRAVQAAADDASEWLVETISGLGLRFTVRDGWRSGTLDAALSWCLTSGAMMATAEGYVLTGTPRSVPRARTRVLTARDRATFRFAARAASRTVNGGQGVPA